MKLFPIFLVLLLACSTLVSVGIGQTPWTWNMDSGPAVSKEGEEMHHPFAGGLSAPQWSMIDMDWDGDRDLFSFDRDGHRTLVFENDGSGGWIERPDWSVGWPDMQHWVLLRDFDCDGLPDLFMGFQNSIHVWKNTSTGPGVPQFTPYATPLMASWDFGSGAQDLPVICLTIDKPAIFDVDEDGDLDVITFTETSTTLYRFSGQSECGLDMVCTNRCYGMVSEGAEDNSLFIGEDHSCGFNVVNPEGRPEEESNDSYEALPASSVQRDGVHAGGAITALQLDGEDFHDLLISDVTYPNLSGLFLMDAVDGQDSTAWVDHTFPYLIPHAGPVDAVNLDRFPAAYPIDWDADGDWDLAVSPNTALEINDDQCVQLWENQGTAADPLWALVHDDWLQDGMIDVGRGAIPHLADLDGDGDLDLAIGNKERYEGVNETPTALALFENVGNSQNPEFNWATWSAIDFASNGIESAFPTTGDVDQDGDLDLLVGDELGLLHLFMNSAGPGAWPVWELETLGLTDQEGTTIDVGQFAAPQWVDVNEDGLLDIVIGEKNGTLSLYLGCGEETAPAWCLFVSEAYEENWGGIEVNNALGINGYATPALYRDENGLHVCVGNELGAIQYFGLVNPTELGEPLNNLVDQMTPSTQGLRASGALGDLNQDGIPEMLVGIQNGGVRWYQGTTTHVGINAVPASVLACPNPVRCGQLIQLIGNDQSSPLLPSSWQTACWVDTRGREIPVQWMGNYSLRAPSSPGLYMLSNIPSSEPERLIQEPIRVMVVTE